MGVLVGGANAGPQSAQPAEPASFARAWRAWEKKARKNKVAPLWARGSVGGPLWAGRFWKDLEPGSGKHGWIRAPGWIQRQPHPVMLA